MYTSSITITVEELKTFHKIDRELYARLVTSLNREPIESMQIIALWLWLEQLGFPNIILKMLSLTDSVVKSIVQEGVSCLNCLSSEYLSKSTKNINIPMTRNLLETPISLQFIHENRALAITGIAKIVNDVCLRAFDDIAQEAMAKAAEEETVPLGNVSGGSDHDQQGSGVRVGNMIVYPAPLLGTGLLRPVYQHPLIGFPPSALLVGGSLPIGLSLLEDIGSNLNPQAEPYNPNQAPTDEIPQDDRTMFVTFSRGYPMTEGEVIEFFTKRFGDCIEEMHMQEVPPNTQSLFARIVFYSSLKISEILDGRERVKFIINGKHVWVRRYEVRQGRRSSRPAPVGGSRVGEGSGETE